VMKNSFQKIDFTHTSSGIEAQTTPFLGTDRSALLIVALFVISVLSISKFRLLAVISFAAFPIFLMGAAKIPASIFLKRLLHLSPFVLFMAAGNLLLDRTPFLQFFGLTITGGMLSGAVIVAKTMISIAGLISATLCIPFYRICRALEAYHVPEVLVTQLMLLYRYSAVLGEEAASMQKARDMRSFGNRGKGLFRTASLIGSLLLRTSNRAEKIYRSMSARGFQGRISSQSAKKFTSREWMNIGLWALFFLTLRLIF
jgi:cobalt/nickel transport system permease protein